jgi:hypothetical protein
MSSKKKSRKGSTPQQQQQQQQLPIPEDSPPKAEIPAVQESPVKETKSIGVEKKTPERSSAYIGANPCVKPFAFWLRHQQPSHQEVQVLAASSHIGGSKEGRRTFEPFDTKDEKVELYDGPLWTDPAGLPKLNAGQMERGAEWRRAGTEMRCLIGEQSVRAIRQDLVKFAVVCRTFAPAFDV